MKSAIVSVINDLVTDQRVNKSCLALQKAGFEVLLVGRKQRKSPLMDERPYASHRMKLLFEKGPLFYAEYNIRLFLFLFFHRANLLLSNDLDTILPNYFISRLKGSKMVFDSHEYFTETPELVHRPKVQKVWKRIEGFVVPKLSEMITVCDSIADLFREKYGVKCHGEARHTQMRDRASGVHPDVLEPLPPQKTRVCLLYCFVLSPLISLGAVLHHHLALSVKELT